MPIEGVLLDVDGTLVDTNALHVQAWVKAFAGRGYKIAPDRIAVEIGKGGDTLVPSILGEEANEQDGDALRKAQPEAFNKLSAAGFKPFAGVQELLQALRARGLRTVVATSSKQQQLALIEQRSGLPITRLVDEIVTADDIEKSKPHPDAVHAALKKIGLGAAQCVMIGDTPYDSISARQAGVICLGVLTGDNDGQTLAEAGARRSYRDPFQLWQHLDEALLAASPSRVRLTNAKLDEMMQVAIDAARAGMAAGEVPIGSALFDGDGVLIASGFNEMNRSQCKTAHAEMVTFARAAGRAPLESRDLILVSTLEPCVMCTGAAMEAAVDVIAFGLKAPYDAGSARVTPPRSPESQMPRIVGNIRIDECRGLLKQWLAANAGSPQARFVEQLLAAT